MTDLGATLDAAGGGAPPPPQTSEIGFILAVARALHRYGTPAHRLEEAVELVSARLGLDCEVFSTPTAIVMSFGEPAELRTRMLRAESTELNMSKLEAVDEITAKVADRELSPEEGLEELARVTAAPPRFSPGVVTLAQSLASGAMAVFFGGGGADVAAAAAIGLALGLLARWAHRRRPAPPPPPPPPDADADAPPPGRPHRRSRGLPVISPMPPPDGEPSGLSRVFELVAALVAALTASLLAALWPAISASLVTVASLIVLLPGLALTVAMTELATRNLISGTARLMSAVIVLLELVVGVAIGEHLVARFLDIPRAVPTPLPPWTMWLSLAASALGVAIVLQSRWRSVGWILLACVAGTLGSRLGAAWLGKDLGVVGGAFALGVAANVYARVLDRSSQTVIVPAALLLVPGSIGFQGMISLIDRDTISGVDAMFAMFVVATAIVAGLLLANSVVSPRRLL
ncbi:MAG: threonine/serine exporter family protein [Kofleriaceae bacterium]